jgi:hypothetical protein
VFEKREAQRVQYDDTTTSRFGLLREHATGHTQKLAVELQLNRN